MNGVEIFQSLGEYSLLIAFLAAALWWLLRREDRYATEARAREDSFQAQLKEEWQAAHERERSLAERVRALENDQKTQLEQVIRENTEAFKNLMDMISRINIKQGGV